MSGSGSARFKCDDSQAPGLCGPRLVRVVKAIYPCCAYFLALSSDHVTTGEVAGAPRLPLAPSST